MGLARDVYNLQQSFSHFEDVREFSSVGHYIIHSFQRSVMRAGSERLRHLR
jgi:hypothetical protein